MLLISTVTKTYRRPTFRSLRQTALGDIRYPTQAIYRFNCIVLFNEKQLDRTIYKGLPETNSFLFISLTKI